METIHQTEVRRHIDTDGNDSIRRQTVAADQTVPSTIFAVRLIYYIGGAIITLLALRFILLLFGASQASSFVNFIYNFSNFFVAPFNGIFTRPTYGTATFDSATLVAMIVYSIVTIGLARLMTLNRRDRDIA